MRLDDASSIDVNRFIVSGMAVSLLAAVTTPVPAADGDLDKVFGSQGYAFSDATSGGPVVSSPAVQADGKVLICEGPYLVNVRAEEQFRGEFVVTRFTADGALDTSFGPGGHARIDFADRSNICSDLTLDRDGRIIVVGTSWANVGPDRSLIAIARLDTNGFVDASFGDGSGTRLLRLRPDGVEIAIAMRVRVDDDGKILVAGNAFNDSAYGSLWTLVRLNPDGGLDASFADRGLLQFPIAPVQPFDIADLDEMSRAPGDRTVVAGFNSNGLAVARVTRDGRIDESFGEHGRSFVAFANPGPDDNYRSAVSSIATQADGRILLGLGTDSCRFGASESITPLFRMLPNGQLDSSFGDDGLLAIHTDAGCASVTGIAERADGRLFLAIPALGHHASIRLVESDGSPSLAFGDGGRQVYELPSSFYSMSIQHINVMGNYTYLSGAAVLAGSLKDVPFIARIKNLPQRPIHSHHGRPERPAQTPVIGAGRQR